MALEPRELFTSNTKGALPRIEPSRAHPRTFAQAGAVKTLPVGTALGRVTATGEYTEFDPAGADGSEKIRGFVASVEVEVSDTGEVVGTVMLEGQIHRDDIIADLATGAQLETELRSLSPSMRERGFDIVGLTQVP